VRLAGVGVSSGRCCARVYVYQADPAAAGVAAADPAVDAETARRLLDEALVRSAEELTRVEAEVTERAGAEHGAIFASHRLVLDDEEWLEPIQAGIDQGEPVAAAVWRVSEELADELRQIDDEYLRERATDILDVAKRVMAQLGCDVRAALPSAQDGEVVLAAYELTPSDTVGLDPTIVRGIVTEVGARTSHAAILARQLGIPAVVGVPGLLDAVRSAETIALDGDGGDCELDPEPETVKAYQVVSEALPVVVEPVSTRDGVAITVSANAGGTDDVVSAVAMGADGIGLYRTEFLFLRDGTPPDEEAQVEAYSAAAEAAQGRPVVFRTLDVGADKSVPGIELPHEDNPFLGVRGIRLSLQERTLFEIQLRALARTSRAYPNVKVMVPMVGDLNDLRRVQEIVDELGAADALHIGTMIEVPSAAILVREMAPLVDFFSVGTNDLTGYVLAVDRTNPSLGDLYDELHPAVLRTLQMIAAGAEELQTPVSVCGEVAGDPLALPVLIGLGLRSLSVAAPLVPRVKAAVQSISVDEARELALRVLATGDAAEARAALTNHPTLSR
jgi:phosphoenolpyruvate-protein phosphotransferase (PTS system enzyme I)